jgi:hypothetical protein
LIAKIISIDFRCGQGDGRNAVESSRSAELLKIWILEGLGLIANLMDREES